MVAIAEGRVIAGKYLLVRALARGGMGSVWVVRHQQLDALMAAKFMDTALVSSPVARARFEREARAAAQLRSTHVVQVHDYGVDEGTPYLVMELLQGEDLGARIRRVGRLSPAAVADILVQAGRALRRAHEAGIVHRDLKPGNVFLTHNDDVEVVKVLDFGIAKATHVGASGEETTKTGQILGSPHYLSPEQARRANEVDHRTDLWALAVIAYRALTGEYPFASAEIYELILSICNDPATPPSHHVPDLGPEIDRFFERAFAKDPAARFQSAPELAVSFAKSASITLAPSELLQTTPGMRLPEFSSLPVKAAEAPGPQSGVGSTVVMPHSRPGPELSPAEPPRAETVPLSLTHDEVPPVMPFAPPSKSYPAADPVSAEGTLTQAPSVTQPEAPPPTQPAPPSRKRSSRGSFLGFALVALLGVALGGIAALRYVAPSRAKAADPPPAPPQAAPAVSASETPRPPPPVTAAAPESAVPSIVAAPPPTSSASASEAPKAPAVHSAAPPLKPWPTARPAPRPVDPYM